MKNKPKTTKYIVKQQSKSFKKCRENLFKNFSKLKHQKLLLKCSQKASAKYENVVKKQPKLLVKMQSKITETKCENVFKKAAKPKASQNVVKKCENEKM